MAVVDTAMAVIPRRTPSSDALQRCRIISHRGEHDNRSVMENTLDAFRAARDAGVWGIECDIRFTADLVPVICHDASPLRVFGHATDIAGMTFAQLRRDVPGVPSLEEVIAQFGGNTHLMLEVKSEPRPDRDRQRETLRELLAGLTPCADYHVLALDVTEFEFVDFLPATCWLPVSEINVPSLSRFALERGCAGLGGHYLLLNGRVKARHDARGQKLGVGFPASRNCLFRELNRGVEWIFSNDAVKLQRILDQQRQ